MESAQQDCESDYSEEEEEEEADCIENDVYVYCDYEENYRTTSINPVLMNDIRLLREGYGDSTVCYRSLDMLCEMDLDILIPTYILEKCVAEAWDLVYGLPIVVQLCVNEEMYLNLQAVNKIDVFQRDHSRKSGALIQIKSIVEEFCSTQFKKLTNDIVQNAVEEKPENTNSFTEDANSRSAQGSEIQNIDYFLPENSKVIPSLKQGFLVQLYLYVQQRLLTLNTFCPICDNPHGLALCMMLKPVICSNPLCIFSFQTLGVMAAVGHCIVTETKVVNLLICLTKAAAKSERKDLILTPFPTIIHPRRPNEMALHDGNKNYDLLNVVLAKIPHVEVMSKYNEADLEKFLNETHELCYPLIRWIISSNRSHIVTLPHEMQLHFMRTKHQFMMRFSPPLEDKQFRKHREKYGSTFAFHGSPIENWHSIIREGLIVASGTKRMINGSAYGKGIYLSPRLAVSCGYSRMYANDHNIKGGKKSCDSSSDYICGEPDKLTCITLCEGPIPGAVTCHQYRLSQNMYGCAGMTLFFPKRKSKLILTCLKCSDDDPNTFINSPHLKMQGDIWVCDKSEYVCTRFFFVYDQHNSLLKVDSNINTATPIINQQIMAVTAKMGM